MTDRFVRDPERGIWRRPAGESLPYSDGADIEAGLLGALKACRDVSSGSAELLSLIRDWPSRYHLSPLRHNLIRHLEVRPGATVLERGCGCGAMTRFLGEAGARVIAVEGSLRRAEIAAERCRDLPNVSVYCDNVAEFEFPERFDTVLLIGVLEYAPMLLRDEDCVQKYLAAAAKFLADGGRLILAIENQLGLKYLAGHPEDHLGIAGYGVHDLYTRGTPVTFGRRELASLLARAGLVHQQFMFPFPDYKLPTMMLGEAAPAHPTLRCDDLLHRSVSRCPTSAFFPSIAENLAWRPIVRNELLADLANSFLVTASPDATAAAEPAWLARSYAAERAPDFATCTEIRDDGDGRLSVCRQPLSKAPGVAPPHPDLPFRHAASESSPYVAGELLVVELQRALARGCDASYVADWAAPWLRLLGSDPGGLLGSDLVSGAHLDTTPSNIIRQADGSLVAFDREWIWHAAIPIQWVVLRGLVNALVWSGPVTGPLAQLTVVDVANEILRVHGARQIDAQFLAEVGALEDSFQAAVHARPPASRFASYVTSPLRTTGHTLSAQRIEELERELDRTLASWSWKLTRPLRWLREMTGSSDR